jgi:hypothetical protein
MKLLHFQGKFYKTQMLQKDLGNKNVVLETWSIVILIILNVNHPPGHHIYVLSLLIKFFMKLVHNSHLVNDALHCTKQGFLIILSESR